MTATVAEALELALWLHRVPARRAALLGRPVPDGIGQLLRVAGGGRDHVAAAAMITGEDEAVVLEAVRFYLQQILFHDDADAYRVLGLRPDASPDQAREHHRLLQQWLHPDRRGNDGWESVYATRVNRAWSHLRTPQARAAYDETLSAAGVANPHGGSRRGGEFQVPGRHAIATSPQGRRNRSRNLTLVVLLGCVGLLALIALRREDPPQWNVSSTVVAASEPPPQSQPPPQEDPVALETLGEALMDAIVPAHAPASEPATRVPVAPPSAASVASISQTQRTVAPVTIPVPPPPANRHIAIPATIPSPPVVADVANALATHRVRSLPVGPAAETVNLVATEQIVAPLADGAAAATSIPDPFERMNQARMRAGQVTDFLRDLAAVSPAVWNDLGTLRRAQEIRAALHERHGGQRTVPLQLGESEWRLSVDGARLECRYRLAQEDGEFELDFTWREDQLLIRGISMVPDA